jgi:hypothetical protein
MLTDPRTAVGVALAGGVGAALLLPRRAAAQKEEEIDLPKLPKEILESAKEMFPKADWKKATKQTDDGETYYELAGVLPGKLLVVVEIDPEGEVFHIQTEINKKDVPKVVMDAFRKKYPGAEIEAVFQMEEEDGEDGFDITGYEFMGSRVKKTPGKGKKKGKEEKVEFSVFVTPDGKVEQEEK